MFEISENHNELSALSDDPSFARDRAPSLGGGLPAASAHARRLCGAAATPNHDPGDESPSAH
ncbi:MAG: hypothetical protein IBJ10_01250 [Phycisphaerales bacterium]|nr:hypothetical protein [Phycisphaerales bacterium]